MNEQMMNAENQVVYFDTNYLNSKESGLRYFKMPQFLVNDSRFWKLSSDAKVVYCVMLNRLPLSMQNGWKVDDLFYIYFSIETVMKVIQCSKSKAVRVMKELKNFKLIEGRRCSDHRKMRYLFLDISLYVSLSQQPCSEESRDFCADETPESKPLDEGAGNKSEPDKSQNDTCTGSETEPEQVPNEVPKETDPSETDSSHKDLHHQEPQSGSRWRWTREEWKEDLSLMWKGEMEHEASIYRNYDMKNMDDLISKVSKHLSRRDEYRINGRLVNVEDVHLRLMMLNCDEVGYAVDYLYNGAYQCSSFAAYAVTVLFNAPDEAEQYWMNKVRYDDYYDRRYGGAA